MLKPSPTEIGLFMYNNAKTTGEMPTNAVVQAHFGITRTHLANSLGYLRDSGVIEREFRRGIKNGDMRFVRSLKTGLRLKRPIGGSRKRV